MIPYLGMNNISKIKRCGVAWQKDLFPPGGKHTDIVVVEIGFYPLQKEPVLVVESVVIYHVLERSPEFFNPGIHASDTHIFMTFDYASVNGSFFHPFAFYMHFRPCPVFCHEHAVKRLVPVGFGIVHIIVKTAYTFHIKVRKQRIDPQTLVLFRNVARAA